MKFIIGKKLDMTQVWQDDKAVAVTSVQAGPCAIVQVKTDEKDGYSSVQVGYGKRRKKNINKPQLKHMEKAGVESMFLREFRICDEAKKDLKIGDVIGVSTFEVGDKIQVTSTSKGKGFQGVVKRHGFHGQDKTHGTKDQLRMPGSIGATGPAHVFKGQKMPGRMGGDRVTVKGLEIVEVDKENNVLLVKGAVPGARNGLVLIQGEGELKITQKHENTENTETSASPTSQGGQKHENTENTETPASPTSQGGQKHENKDENIEEVVVEAAEKVEESKKEEKDDKEENK